MEICWSGDFKSATKKKAWRILVDVILIHRVDLVRCVCVTKQTISEPLIGCDRCKSPWGEELTVSCAPLQPTPSLKGHNSWRSRLQFTPPPHPPSSSRPRQLHWVLLDLPRRAGECGPLMVGVSEDDASRQQRGLTKRRLPCLLPDCIALRGFIKNEWFMRRLWSSSMFHSGPCCKASAVLFLWCGGGGVIIGKGSILRRGRQEGGAAENCHATAGLN